MDFQRFSGFPPSFTYLVYGSPYRSYLFIWDFSLVWLLWSKRTENTIKKFQCMIHICGWFASVYDHTNISSASNDFHLFLFSDLLFLTSKLGVGEKFNCSWTHAWKERYSVLRSLDKGSESKPRQKPLDKGGILIINIALVSV